MWGTKIHVISDKEIGDNWIHAIIAKPWGNERGSKVLKLFSCLCSHKDRSWITCRFELSHVDEWSPPPQNDSQQCCPDRHCSCLLPCVSFARSGYVWALFCSAQSPMVTNNRTTTIYARSTNETLGHSRHRKQNQAFEAFKVSNATPDSWRLL